MDGGERERKRLRVSEDINEFAARNGLEVVDPSFFDDISDVEAAISSILGRVPDQSIYPKIILKHQLYCIIKNRTEVESEIEALKRRGRIRTFPLPINASYIGVMMSKDYDADILRVAQRCGETGDQNTESALRCFCKLIAGRISSNISLSELTGNEEKETKSTEPSCIDRGSLSKLTESGVDAVMAAGFILPKRDTPLMDMYYITHPKIGELCCALEHMSQDIVKTIKRSKYKEVIERSLTSESNTRSSKKGAHGYMCGKKKVPKDGWVGMGWKYHVYDMVGRGDLLRIDQNVSEPVLRLPAIQS